MTTLSPSTLTTARDCSAGIDPRGPRFAAVITTVVLAAALVLASPVLLALQAAVFAVGAFSRRPELRPYGILFRTLVRPHLAPAEHLEDPASSRFAQACGLTFSLVGLLGFAVGAQWLALAAIGLALAAAFLSAAFDFCIGCEIYLRARRLRS